jgi:hypothetical protein
MRDAITLTSIVTDNVEPESPLYSDDWKAYNLLQSSSYNHRIVQDKKSFVFRVMTVFADETCNGQDPFSSTWEVSVWKNSTAADCTQ